MGTPKFWCTLLILASVQHQILCSSIHKVGDLDSWGIPTSSNPQLYSKWSNFHNLTIGDSLFFLYPPSQDSVIQVTKSSYESCNVKNPILHLDNGNSLFNITRAGNFYFTSPVEGHCQKSQKLHIFVYGNGSYADPPDYPAASAPSYPTLFGPIPAQSANSSSSSSSLLLEIPVLASAVLALFVSLLLI